MTKVFLFASKGNSAMNTPALRALIRQAQTRDGAQDELTRRIGERRTQLHHSVRLDQGNADQLLGGFVSAYLDQVPELLDAADAVAREAGIEDRLKPVLRLAQGFFLTQYGEPLASDLIGLLDESYLAHRLIEEINDRYITHLGQPLIPLDMTVANLIAYQLIGEDRANRLDAQVANIVATLLDEQAFSEPSVREYRERLSNPRTLAAWKRWPCLSRQLGVDLQLNAQTIPD